MCVKRFYNIITLFIVLVSATSCAMTKNLAMNAALDALAGADKNGKAAKSDSDAMLAVMGETDTVLVSDFFPSALKTYDILCDQNPKHQGMLTMTGSLHVMYANVFVQSKAEMLGINEYDLQDRELKRAKMHYLRGRDYVLNALDLRYKGFKSDLLSKNDEKVRNAVSKLKASDVEAAYWLGAGWMGAFSLDPLDGDLLGSITAALAVLEKADELDPSYNGGAIKSVLCAYYAAATPDLGGSMDKALKAYEDAQKIAGGKSVGLYVTYALSICVPNMDMDGFKDALDKALLINPSDNPSSCLENTLMQEKAKWIREHGDNYFIFWE